MFEKLRARVERAAQRRAERQRERIARRLREELPPDVEVEANDEGVSLSGRALDAALRRAIAGATR